MLIGVGSSLTSFAIVCIGDGTVKILVKTRYTCRYNAGQTDGYQFPAKHNFVLYSLQTVSGAHQTPSSRYRRSYLGVNRPRCQSDHWPSTNEVKNSRDITSRPKLLMGVMGEGALHREDKVTETKKKSKSGYWSHWGSGTKTNWPTDWSQYNLKLNLRHCTANYRPVLSSERAPYMKKKVIVTQINVTSGHLLQKGQDTKTNWPTDRR
jgi:hypothetical protein